MSDALQGSARRRGAVGTAGVRLIRKMPLVRRLFDRIALLESFAEQFRAQIIEKNDRISALEALLATAQQEIVFRRAPLGNDIEAIESILAEYSPQTLARFFAHRRDLPSTLMIVGEGVPAERLSAALAFAGFTVERSPTAPEHVVDGCGIVWAGKTFDPAGYRVAAALRTRFPGRVFTAFGLLSGACLFWAADRLVGYHTPREKLLQWLTATGRGVMANLNRMNDLFPIEGKRVVEFGPLEGAMTAGLLHLGAAEVCVVEIRMTNLLKLLSAAHSFGWRRLRVVVEDMHMVDASTIGRFDLVVAHGVYYHSADPFRFLRNIASLSDTIHLGGYCADPEGPAQSLVELRHEERTYRAQPYDERLGKPGAGAYVTGYYFVPDDLLAFMARLGFTARNVEITETAPHKAARYYLRALLQR